MMDKKISLRTIAEHFDVSVTTISLALRGDKSISESMRDKIIQYAQENGYRPPSASKSSFGFVAVIIPIETETIRSWGLFTEIEEAVEETFGEQGYKTIIIPTKANAHYEHILRATFGLPIEAIISIHYVNKELFKALQKYKYPIVVLNNNLVQDEPESPEDNFFSILVDDIQGGLDACNRLLENNHKSILYIDYHRSDLPHIMIDRKLGVEKAVLLKNEDITLFHERLTKISIAHIEKILEKYISKITAIAVHDDFIGEMVYGVMRTYADKFSNISFISMGGIAREIPVEFSSYQIEGKKLGKLAADTILQHLEQKENSARNMDTHTYRVGQVYIDRGSVKKI